MLNYPRLRVLTRYSTVRVLRALRREVNTGDGLFCAFPKFSLAHVHTLFREAQLILSVARSPQNNFIPCDTIRLGKKILQNEDCTGGNFQCQFMHGINSCISLLWFLGELKKIYGKRTERNEEVTFGSEVGIYWEMKCNMRTRHVHISPSPGGRMCTVSQEVLTLGDADFFQH